ncbi:MAG: patatin-like phospholipase family protein, partial [Calditrichia bacterium]|nr:patatin-like phospholipase family protein [Calditrichia bacterium]
MKHLFLIFQVIIFVMLFTSDSFSQKSDSLITQNSKPLKLGLALSGGGAKGIAQIPVLEALEKHKIPVHCIAGTSIGSIVGGLYAIGYSPKQIKDIFFTTNWDKVLSDEIPRKQQAIYMKPFQDRFMLRLFYDKNKIYIPSGLIWGYNIEKMLAKYTAPAGNIKNFNELPIPFSCVATDLITGEKKIFHEGNLADAIRASMSIPSVFAPADAAGKQYLDGGLVANNPVQEAFDLGADIVLAVDISAPLRGSGEVGDFISIMDQSISFSMYRTSQEALKKTKFVVRPDISPFGVMDFSKAQSIYDSGTVCVKNNLKIFEQLSEITDTTTFSPN